MAKKSSTTTHIGVDQHIKQGYTDNAMNEGFASASGVEPQTAATGGKLRHRESKDSARHTGKVSNHLDEENSGLADS